MFDVRKTTKSFEFRVECGGCKTIVNANCGAGTSNRHTLARCDNIDDILVL